MKSTIIEIREYPDGRIVHIKNGVYHNDNGPAVIEADGRRYFYKEGHLHNLNGPAFEDSNGRRAFYVEGRWLFTVHPDGKFDFRRSLLDNREKLR